MLIFSGSNFEAVEANQQKALARSTQGSVPERSVIVPMPSYNGGGGGRGSGSDVWRRLLRSTARSLSPTGIGRYNGSAATTRGGVLQQDAASGCELLCRFLAV